MNAYPVETFLLEIKNLAAKRVYLNALRSRNAARRNYGLLFRNGSVSVVPIY